MKAINLKTEYLTDPVGIDVKNPRLMWNCEGGIKQTAYRIVATSNGKTVWDSGRVESSSMHAECPVAARSKMRVEWTVTLWDEEGRQGTPASAYYEYGLLAASDWQAQWITGNYRPKTKRKILRAYMGGKAERYPVDCFRRKFTCESAASARLYITACGLYVAKLNGERVGNFVLAPGYTDYKKRIQYQTYDVTDMLKSGQNVLTVDLADGWYRGSVGAWGLLCEYGNVTKLLARLEITDKNGKTVSVVTDGSWEWSNDGSIRFADNKDGEVVEAARVPSYGGKAKITKCAVVPSASNNVPITEHETFKPKLITTPSGAKVLDFGQNIAGYISFKMNGRAGQKLKLRFGELIDKAGEFTQKNIQCTRKGRATPLQQVEYTFKEGANEYKTNFAIFGFQYVLVEGNAEWKPEDFTAIAVYSDLERTGTFTSSNELLNKFVDCTVWSTKNNSADIPTDCPTRERHGWTGDIQIFLNTASYLFDYNAFFKKYLNDVYDWQKKSGRLPQIAPYGGVDFFMWTMNGSVGWSDIGILGPYRIWKKYGDESVLKDYYARMSLYAKFMINRIGRPYITAVRTGLKHRDKKNIVNCGQSFGEWAEPADVYPMNWLKDMAFTHPEESTAYTAFVMEHMAEIAAALGKESDKNMYLSYAERVKKGYQALRRAKDYTLDTNRQAQLVRPLYMHLLDEEQTEYAKKRLISAMEHYGWRVGTGFLSTPLILYVLADIDIEYAYRLLENEEMPGWLYMPKSGATTIWESWEGVNAQGGIASLDHYSKGSSVEWLFDSCCGIKVVGENKFKIAPMPGGHLTFAQASYKSVYGLVESGWKREGGKTVYTISVPCNCTAEVVLPGGTNKTVGAGTYTFTA